MGQQVKCMFCGAEGDTREHVIPQWLHQMFNIKHKRVRVRNGSSVKYMHQVLPACKHCNGVRFAEIENKIKNNSATDQELFLWALKVYVGLNIKDTGLLEERSRPEMGFVLTENEAFKGVGFASCLLSRFGSEEFRVYPSPFGSVFLHSLPSHVDSGFALCSIGYPYNVITISIGRNRLLSVILNDKGLVKKAISNSVITDTQLVEECSKFILEKNETLTANSYAKLLTMHYARYKCRIKIPTGFSITKNRIAAMRIPKKVKFKEYDEAGVTSDIVNKIFKFSA